MSSGYQALTEKEKQTLRLMVRGHDAKSMARQLGLSVHTVNERLREARRKLQVSSSREAARLVFDTEGERPQNLVTKQIGEASTPSAVGKDAALGTGRKRRFVWAITGAVIMSLILGLLALSSLSGGTAPSTVGAEQSAAPLEASRTESEATRSARLWLELTDQGRWKDAYEGTTSSFRTSNTLERWTEVALSARPPLGAVISRTALSEEGVPAPPAGVKVVKFRTNFANKQGVLETVSLAREGSDWKVAGVYID
jgi:DNA-binding CsgD family transcriptional regulator